MEPDFAGFKLFVQNVMGVPAEAMPDDTWLQYAFDEASNIAYSQLANIPSLPTSPSIYAIAVYSLGGHYLVGAVPDDPTATPPNNTYWQDLRTKFGIYSFTPGLVNQAHDQGTGQGMYILPVFSGLTMMGLDMMKDPWGRRYLEIAGQWGSVWGLTA